MKEASDDRKWRKGLEWGFLILAYLFLLYKVCTYDNYPLFFSQLSEFSQVEWGILLVVFLLLPFNLLCEATKWKYLLSPLMQRSLIAAYYDVFKGLVAAFATPNRLGEFPGRVLWMPSQMQIPAIALGFIGSFLQTIIIFVFGFPAIYRLFHNVSFITQPTFYLIFGGLIVFVALVTVLHFSQRLKLQFEQLLRTISQLTAGHFLIVLVASAFRYTVFAFQLYLMLHCCHIYLSPHQALVAIPAYYFLVTFTPSISAAEPAVRGSWAMVAFAPFSSNMPGIAMAAILLWIINGVIPLLIGSLLKRPQAQ